MRRNLEDRVTLREALGLELSKETFVSAWRAVTGSKFSQRTTVDWGARRMLKPWLGPATWLGVKPKKVTVLNYFNHGVAFDQLRHGFDLGTSSALDHRGLGQTYNTHFGTDFVIPVGTPILASAAGTVCQVENRFDRGGLKVFIEHGGGLQSLYNHLSRTEVRPGDQVAAGQRIGLSGMSSIDGLLFFPWLPPHLHFSVFLNGLPVDPYARGAERSMWLNGPDSSSHAKRPMLKMEPTKWDVAAISIMASSCKDPELKDLLIGLAPELRGSMSVYHRYFNYAAFAQHPPLTRDSYSRSPWFDLPYDRAVHDGAA